jgi:Xaa-Pro aminopeptidase
MNSGEQFEEIDAILIVAGSETDSNLYYATRFLAPDPFIFFWLIESGAPGKKVLLMSDLEIDRAKSESSADRVLSYSEYETRAQKRGIEKPGLADVLSEALSEFGAQRLLVPGTFPLEQGDKLREKGYRLRTKREPFFEERAVKSSEEVKAIGETQRATEEAVEAAMEILRRAEIRGDRIYHEGEPLTSEAIKQVINLKLMERGCVAQHTIVACGDDACDPHNQGSGPLKPHQPIIFDVFPRSGRSRYFADMSRTVVKGRASERQKALYRAVLDGQEIGFEKIRDGASGREIHLAICGMFEERGFKTGLINGRMQGFFHGTGHGLGLDIHEPPRIAKSDWILKKGEVVTVEPGLYYPGVGAVRVEDMVRVEEKACVNLTRFSKVLEID